MGEVDTARRVGRYELLSELGTGGMATVFLARQLDLNRLVALKRLGEAPGQDSMFALRFMRESRLAGSLAHPNIVTVFDFIEQDGVPYIAMELMQRGNLRPYIDHGMTLAQLGGALCDTLAGLAYAERLKVVHRDLKPENLMVSGEGTIKIADFGIAKAVEPVLTNDFRTETGTTIGTPAYMAPEQAMAQEVGPWTDLYSLGCIAYEMLAGQRPFADVSAPMAVMIHHVNEEIPPAVSVNPDAPAALSDWIDRLLVKDVTRRTQRAEVALDELDEILTELVDARWRRRSALDEQIGPSLIPGPYTPPPPEAVQREDPSTPVYHDYVPGARAAVPPAQATPDALSAVPPAAVVTPPEPPPAAMGTVPGLLVTAPKSDSPAADAVVVEPPKRTSRRRSRVAALLVSIVAAAIVAGVLVGRLGAPKAHAAAEPLSRTASNPRIELRYPASWQKRRPTALGSSLGLESELAVAPHAGGAGVEAGLTRTAAGPSLVADGFVSSLAEPLPKPQRVQLGPLAAYRYAGVRVSGTDRVITLLAAPTTDGVLTIVSADGSDAQRIVSSVELRRAHPLVLGADPVYARTLSTALARLNEQRAVARTKLKRATGPNSQAAAAAEAARAYDGAARALRRAHAGPAETPAHGSLLSALVTTRVAYTALGRAAKASKRAAYVDATTAVTRGERAVNSTLARLKLLGYSVA